MKTLVKLFFVGILIFIVSSCDKQNPLSTNDSNNQVDNVPIASYHMQMSVVQNGDNASYFLYGGDEIYSIYGSSDETFFTRKEPNSTFEVTCIYSWQNNVSSSIAGIFRITGDSFNWNSGYIYPNGTNGSDTSYFTVNLQNAKTYHAIMWNSTFDKKTNK